MRVRGVGLFEAKVRRYPMLLAFVAVASVAIGQDMPSTWGENKYGTLGRGNNSDQWLPGKPVGLDDVAMMSGGGYHTLFLKKDGTVWSSGNNLYGELGLGHNSDRNVPTQIPGLSNIVFVSAGTSHSLAIDALGNLYAWGRNSTGQLGTGNTTHQKSPVLITGIPPVKFVDGGEFHTLAITTNGQVWAWGWNKDGQLGNGTNTDSRVPIFMGLTNAVKVSAGYQHSLVLTGRGEVWAFGNNLNGQLGNGTTKSSNVPLLINRMDRATDISARKTSVALKADNTVWEWGGNFSGKLIPIIVDNLQDIVSISIGTIHTMALQSDGRLWCWGNNPDGQLGTGNTLPSPFPTQAQISNVNWINAGGYHSLATTGNLPARPVYPFDRQFFLGTLTGGITGSLYHQDGDRLVISRQAGTGTNWAIDVWFYGYSCNETPTSLSIQTTSSTNQFGVMQEISAFNFETWLWEVVDTRLLSLFDSQVNVQLTGNLMRFLNFDREVRMRVRYRSAMVTLTPWEARIDRAIFSVR